MKVVSRNALPRYSDVAGKKSSRHTVQLSDGDVNGIAFVFRLDGADKSLGVNSRVCS